MKFFWTALFVLSLSSIAPAPTAEAGRFICWEGGVAAQIPVETLKTCVNSVASDDAVTAPPTLDEYIWFVLHWIGIE